MQNYKILFQVGNIQINTGGTRLLESSVNHSV